MGHKIYFGPLIINSSTYLAFLTFKLKQSANHWITYDLRGNSKLGITSFT